MNSAQLEAFVRVYEVGSVSKAAELLYVSQPAVTKRVQALEEILAVPLFDHFGRGIAPTPYADRFYAHAKRWLNEFDEVRLGLKADSETLCGRLSLGVSHHMGRHYLPKLISKWSKQHPEVEIDVSFVDSEEAHARVTSGELALSFLTLPAENSQLRPDLSYTPLFGEAMHFVAAPSHPLSAQSTLKLKDLTKHRALLPSINTFTSRLVVGEFATRGHKLSYLDSNNPLDEIRVLVSMGLGWSVLPEALLDKTLVRLNVEDDPHMNRKLGLVRHPARTQSATAEHFYQFVCKEYSIEPN